MHRFILFLIFSFSIQSIYAQSIAAFTLKKQNSNEEWMNLLKDAEGNIFLLGNVTLYPDQSQEKYHSDGIGFWKFKTYNKQDTQFGDKGYFFHSLNDSLKRFASLATITPDDKIIVLANFNKLKPNSVYESEYVGINIIQFNKNGSLDNSFGHQGMVTLDFDKNHNRHIKTKSLKFLEDGSLLFMGSTGPGINKQADKLIVGKLLPGGALDQAFGEKGIASDELEKGLGSMPIDMVVDSKNRILVASYYIGGEKEVKFSGRQIILRRFLENGVLDPTFGDRGKQSIYTLEKHFALVKMDLNSKNELLLAGAYHIQKREIDVFVTSIDLSKTINPVLEQNKTVIFDVKGKQNDLLRGMQVLANDAILLYGNTGKEIYSVAYDQFFFTKIKSDLSLDTGFAEQGVVIHKLEENLGGFIQNHIVTDRGCLFTGTVRPQNHLGNVDAFLIDLNMK